MGGRCARGGALCTGPFRTTADTTVLRHALLPRSCRIIGLHTGLHTGLHGIFSGPIIHHRLIIQRRGAGRSIRPAVARDGPGRGRGRETTVEVLERLLRVELLPRWWQLLSRGGQPPARLEVRQQFRRVFGD
jgi:hypothetical protein